MHKCSFPFLKLHLIAGINLYYLVHLSEHMCMWNQTFNQCELQALMPPSIMAGEWLFLLSGFAASITTITTAVLRRPTPSYISVTKLASIDRSINIKDIKACQTNYQQSHGSSLIQISQELLERLQRLQQHRNLEKLPRLGGGEGASALIEFGA